MQVNEISYIKIVNCTSRALKSPNILVVNVIHSPPYACLRDDAIPRPLLGSASSLNKEKFSEISYGENV